jgi:hypothetical protein
MICPSCKIDNPASHKYCGQCGAPLDPIVERLQATVRTEVEQAIEARLKDQKVVELDTSIAVAERISNWARLFGAILGLPLAMLVVALGFLGVRTYADFTGLIQGARTTLSTELEQGKKEAEAALDQAKEASGRTQKLEDVVNQTEKSVSDVASKLREAATLSSEIDQLKSRASAIQGQLAQASELTNKVNGLTSKVTGIEQRLSKLGKIAIVTNQRERSRALTEYLANHGADIAILSVDELKKLSLTGAEVVIVSPDTAESWAKQPAWALARIFENYKVLGMGRGGSELFSALGLEINSSHVMYSETDAPLTVELSDTLKYPEVVPNSDGTLQIAEKGGNSMGIYDQGSPDIGGFEGIARWNKYQNHWPIARQGNYLLWGINAPLDQMTEAGKHLFVNLLINHKLRASVPLTQAIKSHGYVQPGLEHDLLNTQFTNNTYYFKVREPGQVTAKLSWTPPDRQLTLVMNCLTLQNKRLLFGRKDGVSPIEVGLEATDTPPVREQEWKVDVITFEKNLGDVVIDYNLDLSFPNAVSNSK